MDYCLHCMTKAKGNFCPNCGKRPHEVSSEEYHLAAGTVLKDKYLIGTSIGEGGFGITYIGRDTTLDLKIAVKEYFPDGCANRVSGSHTVSCGTGDDRREVFSTGKDRFLKEARALAKFSGEQGIVTVRDFFEENNTAYIVMEYVDGETLKDLIKRFGVLSAEKTKELITPVMLSLIKIHKEGIIHRDISPSNIMITRNGKAKLLDFGSARSVTGGSNKSLSVLLKPGYAPEEQYRSKGNQGAWTDVYSLCATMYKCITGITPDEAPERVYNDLLKAPSALGIEIDPNFEAALMKGLSVLQKDRYQTVKELMKGMEGRGETRQTAEKTQAEENTQFIFSASQESRQAAPSSIPSDHNVYQESASHTAGNPAPNPANYQNDIPTPTDDKTQYVFAEAQDGGQTDFQNGAPFPSAQQIPSPPPPYINKAKKKSVVPLIAVIIIVIIILVSAAMFLQHILMNLLENEFIPTSITATPITTSTTRSPITTKATTTTKKTTDINSSSSDNVSFKRSYVQNGTWRSETFGICADLGSEWTLYDDETLAAYNEISEMTDEAIQSALSTSGCVWEAKFNNIDPSTDIVTTAIEIGVHDLDVIMGDEAMSEVQYARESLTNVEESWKSVGFSINSSVITTVKFAGSDHPSIFISCTADDQTVYRQYIFIQSGKYMGFVSIGSISEEGLESAAEMFYALESTSIETTTTTEAATTPEKTTDINSSPSDNVSFKHGYTNDGIWKNETLGIGAAFASNGFTCYDDEALAVENGISEMSDEAIQSVLNTRGPVFDALFSNIASTTSIVIGVEDLGVTGNEAMSEIDFAREFLAAEEEDLKSSGFSINTVKFADSYHPSIFFITSIQNDQMIYRQDIFIKSGKYMGYVIIGSVSEEELESAAKMFYALESTSTKTTTTTEAATAPEKTTGINSSSSDNASFKHSYVQDGIWKSETLGIGAAFASNGFTCYDDEALADYNEISEITDETIQSALSTKGYFCDAIFVNTDSSTNVVINVEDLSVTGNEAISETDYARGGLSLLEEKYKSLGYSIDFSTLSNLIPFSLNFAGADHPAGFITYTENDQTVYQQFIFIKSGKYMGNIIITSTNEEDTKNTSNTVKMFYALQ